MMGDVVVKEEEQMEKGHKDTSKRKKFKVESRGGRVEVE